MSPILPYISSILSALSIIKSCTLRFNCEISSSVCGWVLSNWLLYSLLATFKIFLFSGIAEFQSSSRINEDFNQQWILQQFQEKTIYKWKFFRNSRETLEVFASLFFSEYHFFNPWSLDPLKNLKGCYLLLAHIKFLNKSIILPLQL